MVSVRILQGDNLPLLKQMPDASYDLIYIDPPFNTGREQLRATHKTIAARVDAPKTQGTRVTGFKGNSYDRIRSSAMSYDDRFEDFWAFL